MYNGYKKFWRIPSSFNEAHFNQVLDFIFMVSNVCSHSKKLNRTKLDIIGLNYAVYKCYNKYNSVQVLFVVTAQFFLFRYILD